MNRLYVVESCPSVTGTMADHRVRRRARDIEPLARKVAQRLGVRGAPAVSSGADDVFAEAVARDLEKHRGSSLVLAGDQQPPSVHALAHAINHALGNENRTAVYTDPVAANPVDQLGSLRELVADMRNGLVEVLIIVGGNPVFTAPHDLAFADHLSRVKLRVHLGLFEDETSTLCHWHIPEAHFLESWSDARAFDGTVSILQPLIAPLYGGKSAHELSAALAGQSSLSSYETVRGYWQKFGGWKSFEESWEAALHDGLIPGTALPPKRVTLRDAFVPQSTPAQKPVTGLEIAFRPDPTVWDGSFANNGWLQELPKPLTKLTWDNAALLSPATAKRLGLEERGRDRSAPSWGDCARPRLDHAWARRRLRDRALRLWPHACRPCRHWQGVQCVPAAHGGRALVRLRGRNPQDWRPLSSGLDAAPLQHGEPEPGSGGRHRQVPQRPEIRAEDGGISGARSHPVSRICPPGLRLGHVHRHERLHRMRRLHDRLPGREQHPGGRQDRSGTRPHDALDSRRPLLRGHP